MEKEELKKEERETDGHPQQNIEPPSRDSLLYFSGVVCLGKAEYVLPSSSAE